MEGSIYSGSADPANAATESAPLFLIIGAGSRGRGYAQALADSGKGIVSTVAEPDTFKRLELGRRLIWGDKGPCEGDSFASFEDWLQWEKSRRARAAAGQQVPPGIDAAFVCVLDELHRDIVIALASLGGVHIMCEKPLATTLDDCLDIYRALRESGTGNTIFTIGHVLRYSPHNITLRKLVLEDRVIGDVLAVDHTYVVSWYFPTILGLFRKMGVLSGAINSRNMLRSSDDSRQLIRLKMRH